jgi:hypothetical protein
VAAEHTNGLREKLQPMLGSPFGEGLHRLRQTCALLEDQLQP